MQITLKSYYLVTKNKKNIIFHLHLREMYYFCLVIKKQRTII